jgi:hypothetical protein
MLDPEAASRVKLGMERRTQAAVYAARKFADESHPEKEGPDS